MPPERLPDDRAWLEKHLKPLLETGSALMALDRDLPVHDPPTYDRGYWTGLKLIALKYYVRPYLNILAKRTRVGFVDLFAGPGLNRIGKRKVPIPGSPLLPLVVRETAQDRFFAHIFLCEQDEKSFDALQQRVRPHLPPSCGSKFFHGDANDFVRTLPNLVNEFDIGHCLVFVDPEGLEWRWKSMQKLVEDLPCDVIINFPSAGLQRNATKTDLATRRTIADFLGIQVNELPPSFDEEWAIRKYRSGLAELGKNISTEIMITDHGPFHYHLIPAVRQTFTGSQWFRLFKELRDRVHGLHGGILDLVAQQIEGKLGTL